MSFGQHIRKLREAKHASDPGYSARKLASKLGFEPSYISKIERGEEQPSEKVVLSLAVALGEDPDVLLAMAGKVSSHLQAVIIKRPALFAALLQQLKTMPDHAIVRLVREVRDGKW